MALVIIGLLVGGVLEGQTLIKKSRLSNITTEYERYAAAVQNFQDQYAGIPGDISNATS